MAWDKLPSATVEARSTFGFPVDGDFTGGYRAQVPQLTQAEFLELFNAVMADPVIEKIVWEQYTPYFNDGDPCEFGVHGLEVYPYGWEAKQAEGGFDEGYQWELDSSEHPMLGGEVTEWRHVEGEKFRQMFNLGYRGEHEETWRRCRALDSTMQGGSFDNVLTVLFGDHTQVTAYKDDAGQVRVRTEHYSHD